MLLNLKGVGNHWQGREKSKKTQYVITKVKKQSFWGENWKWCLIDLSEQFIALKNDALFWGVGGGH